jgi:hypothetical protein
MDMPSPEKVRKVYDDAEAKALAAGDPRAAAEAAALREKILAEMAIHEPLFPKIDMTPPDHMEAGFDAWVDRVAAVLAGDRPPTIADADMAEWILQKIARGIPRDETEIWPSRLAMEMAVATIEDLRPQGAVEAQIASEIVMTHMHAMEQFRHVRLSVWMLPMARDVKLPSITRDARGPIWAAVSLSRRHGEAIAYLAECKTLRDAAERGLAADGEESSGAQRSTGAGVANSAA